MEGVLLGYGTWANGQNNFQISIFEDTVTAKINKEIKNKKNLDCFESISPRRNLLHKSVVFSLKMYVSGFVDEYLIKHAKKFNEKSFQNFFLIDVLVKKTFQLG